MIGFRRRMLAWSESFMPLEVNCKVKPSHRNESYLKAQGRVLLQMRMLTYKDFK